MEAASLYRASSVSHLLVGSRIVAGGEVQQILHHTHYDSRLVAWRLALRLERRTSYGAFT